MMNFQQEQQQKIEATIFDTELWKRAEQTKFKAHLKQVEYEFLSKKNEELKKIEDQRNKEFKDKITQIDTLKHKLSKMASELEKRENQIKLCEEELKMKINEVSRQLINKDDEIIYIKNRFKEEKTALEKEKKLLTKKLNDKQKAYDDLEETFRQYKKDIEDSPLTLLKNEINRKQIQYEELTKEKNRLQAELDKSKAVNDKLKNDLIKMKKAFDNEKEQMYKQRVDEVEKIKFEIYNQKMSQNEMNELKELREKIKMLTDGPTAGSNINQANNFSTVANPNFSATMNNNNNQMQQGQSLKKEYKILTVSKGRRFYENDATNEIERLTKERDMLLSGKLYEENDPIIIQLDMRIRKLLQNSGNY
jgi:chromosome segregation ATPase